MRYTIVRDQRVPPPRKLAWALVGLCFVLAGSAALAWQNGGSKLRPAQVEEVATDDPPAQRGTAALQPEPDINADERPLPTPKPTIRRSAPSKPASKIAAAPRTSTAPPRTATTKKSLLPFPVPSFFQSGDTATKRAATTTKADSGTKSNRTSGMKALGGKPHRRAETPADALPGDAESETPPLIAESSPAVKPAVQPKPARSAPRVATRDDLEVDVELPPARAATTKPIVAAAPPITPKNMGAPKPRKVATVVEAPAIPHRASGSTIPRKLAALDIPKIEDVRAAGFQEVTPGESKLSSIGQHLGEPAATELEGETTVMTYQVGPFPKIEVILAGDVVDSVVIHLAEPVDEKAVLVELGLAAFRGVDVLDDDGTILGRAIPERGVALSYLGDPSDRKVAEVVLATITAEPFLMRAVADTEHNYQRVLADAAYAAKLDPTSAEAMAVQGRVLMAIGRLTEASDKFQAAIERDAGASDYRLAYARLLSATGDYDNAIKTASMIAETPGVPPESVAQAHLLWGDLLSHGPQRDYPQAVEHHSKAIRLATPLVQDPHPAIRRLAMLTLVDANLAIARDVAMGNYKRKSEVVPKWIAKAESAKRQAIEDGAGEQLELHVAAGTLAAYAALPEPIDPTAAVEVAIEQGQAILSASTDALYKSQVEWTLGAALVDAVQIEHARGEFSNATQYANNALALLSDNAQYREATPHRDYLLGRMFFAMGAIYAVGQNDHAEAVHYYLQAAPLFEQPLPDDLADEQGRHGERFVSMGVSFWQNGNKPQAVELTLNGANLLRQAVEAGQIEPASLAVPYANLAAMYKQLGNTTEAKKYGELAQKLDATPPVRR